MARRHGHRRGATRCFDLAAGIPLALIATPLIVVLALASWWSFRAWPIFTQRRVGYRGREFTFIKIRSLPTSTSLTADKYALAGVRNTRFGSFIRGLHLDELPQLWLVVTGRMSLVGPRPEMPWLIDRLDPTFQRERTSVKPGCTGLWQLSEDAAKLIGEAPAYDLFYVRNRSVRLDAWVLWRTVTRWCGRRPLDLSELRSFERVRPEPQEAEAILEPLDVPVPAGKSA
jgi:lipopolysaccharide/colanic/teichoic acid biosynthesis glycosyltransferase